MITLIREARPNMKYSDETVCISFTDSDGKQVSVAFDGRFHFTDIADNGGWTNRYEYELYRDCPVINGREERSVSGDDVRIMRFFRDALNDLNLGD